MTPLPSDNADQFRASKFYHRLISNIEAYSEIFLINYLTIPFFEFRMPHLRVTEFYQHSLFTYGDNVDRLGDPLPGKLILLISY